MSTKKTLCGKVLQKSFFGFRDNNFDLKHPRYRNAKSKFEKDNLKALLYNDPHHSSQALSDIMDSNQLTFNRHLNSMDKVEKFGLSVGTIIFERVNGFV